MNQFVIAHDDRFATRLGWQSIVAAATVVHRVTGCHGRSFLKSSQTQGIRRSRRRHQPHRPNALLDLRVAAGAIADSDLLVQPRGGEQWILTQSRLAQRPLRTDQPFHRRSILHPSRSTSMGGIERRCITSDTASTIHWAAPCRNRREISAFLAASNSDVICRRGMLLSYGVLIHHQSHYVLFASMNHRNPAPEHMAARETLRWCHQAAPTHRQLCARHRGSGHLVPEKKEAGRDLQPQFSFIPKLGYSSCRRVLSWTSGRSIGWHRRRRNCLPSRIPPYARSA